MLAGTNWGGGAGPDGDGPMLGGNGRGGAPGGKKGGGKGGAPPGGGMKGGTPGGSCMPGGGGKPGGIGKPGGGGLDGVRLARQRMSLENRLTLEASQWEVQTRLDSLHLGKTEGAYLGYRDPEEVPEERRGWHKSERLRCILHRLCRNLREQRWTRGRSHPSMPCGPRAEHGVPPPTAVGSRVWLFSAVVG